MSVFTIQAPDGRKIKIDAPDEATAVRGAQEWAKANPKKRSVVDNIPGFMANLNRGLVIGDELAAGANVVSGLITGRHRFGTDKPGNVIVNNANMLADAYRAELRGQRDTEDTFAREKPKTAALARGVGMAATVAAPVGPSANMLAATTRLGGAAKGALAAGTTAAGYAAADRGTARERLAAASDAVTNPIVLALGAAGGAAAVPKARAPKQANPEIELLHNEGVTITPGQQGGRITKAVEEGLTSLPAAGDMVAGAQARGVKTFNRAIVNRALKPIGETLPADVAVGHDAVRHAGDRLSAAYERVLPEGQVRIDPRFTADARKLGPIMETMTPAAQKKLVDIMEARVGSRLATDGGVLSGRRFKQVESELEYEIGRFSKAPDPDDRAIGEALKVVQGAMQGAAARQNPKFAAAKDQIDRGWATLVQAETAAAKGADGVFTPKQFMSAVSAGDKRVRRRGVARGEALNQDIAKAGVNILAQKLPDSGTGKRVLQGLIGLGGIGVDLGATAATVGTVSAAYSRPAQDLAQRLLSRRLSRQEEAIALAELKAIALRDPKVQELYRRVAVRLARGSAVSGTPPKPQP